MNAILNNVMPLPAGLHQGSAGPHRRHCIGEFRFEPAHISRFNEVLCSIDPQHTVLEDDHLATAARELRANDPAAGMPICLRQRLWRIGALAHLLGERDWEVDDDAGAAAQVVVGYARDHDDLIPDRLPQIGRLDDAIVADAAWPRVVAEVADYLDYRRVRAAEAGLRGRGIREFHFNRSDWMEAREALDAAIRRQRRRVFASSYLPTSSPLLFRVH